MRSLCPGVRLLMVCVAMAAVLAGGALPGGEAGAGDAQVFRARLPMVVRELPPPAPPPVVAYVSASGVQVFDGTGDGGRPIRELVFGQTVQLKKAVAGRRWIIGDQTWEIAYQPFHDRWYELVEGGYVYSAWVFIPAQGERLPWALPAGELRVVVDIATQRLTAWVGAEAVFEALVSTGKAGYETPPGLWQVAPWGRVEDELMSSTSFNYPVSEQYRVEHVLYTQYFTNEGHALHLNYWRPPDVFGRVATSHGCVGLQLHDAQWLWFAGYAGMSIEVR